MIINDFDKQLAQSERDRDKPYWIKMLQALLIRGRRYKIERFSVDGAVQRSGIDEIITIWNKGQPQPKQFWTDNKVRQIRPGGKKYDDILCEIISNDRTGTPGWAVKDAKTDLIIYLNKMIGRCYGIHFQSLRKLVLERKDDGRRRYYAKNKNYSTINVAFPFEEIEQEIEKARYVDLSDLGIQREEYE